MTDPTTFGACGWMDGWMDGWIGGFHISSRNQIQLTGATSNISETIRLRIDSVETILTVHYPTKGKRSNNLIISQWPRAIPLSSLFGRSKDEIGERQG